MTQKDKEFLSAMIKIDPNTHEQTRCKKFCDFINRIKNKFLFRRG